MQFKCNFCERIIDIRLWGQPKIVCYCGAKYTREVHVTVKEGHDPTPH